MLAQRIAEEAVRSPEQVAAVWNGQSASYQTLSRLIETIRTGLLSHSRPKGVSVLLIRNLLKAWCWMIALRSLGHTTIALRSPLDIGNLELGPIDIMVCDHPERLAQQPGVVDPGVILLSSQLPPIGSSPLQLAAGAHDDRCGGHILLSSGTTGQPKKVVVTAEGDEADIRLHADIMEKSPETRYYAGSFFLTTAAGYRAPLRTWAAGGTVVFNQRKTIPPQILNGEITDADFTPVTLADFLTALGSRPVAKSRMRINILGGAVPWRLFLEARAKLTDQIYSVLGATEAGVIGQTKIESESDLRAHDVAANRIVQIVDESGRPLSAMGKFSRADIKSLILGSGPPNFHFTDPPRDAGYPTSPAGR